MSFEHEKPVPFDTVLIILFIVALLVLGVVHEYRIYMLETAIHELHILIATEMFE